MIKTTATVVNINCEDFDIYIGRPSRYGNPFPITDKQTRRVVIKKFRRALQDAINNGFVTIEDLKSMDGKRLGCYCKPMECHGDVWLEFIEWAINQ